MFAVFNFWKVKRTYFHCKKYSCVSFVQMWRFSLIFVSLLCFVSILCENGRRNRTERYRPIIGDFQKIYAKSVQCNFTLNPNVYPNYSCFAKSYSRDWSAINIYTLHEKPTSDIIVGCHVKNLELVFKSFFSPDGV